MTTRSRNPHVYEPDYVTEPGEVLQETIDHLGMTQRELALRTGYSPKHINLLISGKARITHDAAIRLERVTRVPARFWNNLEYQYQERKARLNATAYTREHLDWLKEIPVKELVRRGVLKPNTDRWALVGETLSFFGVASVEAWRSGWTKTQIAFRKAAGADRCTGLIATWVRLAERTADAIECAPFHKQTFQSALKEIRRLTVESPGIFVPRMKQLCATAGVALSIVPEIPRGRVNGAARWLSDNKAMIAINLRGKSNDRFWFTFFHEAGHLLNDDREQVFVDVEYADDPRELTANRFAADILIPPRFVPELSSLRSIIRVQAFARRIGIHPGIVAGRLRHEGLIPPTHLHGLTQKLEWVDE